LGKKHLFLHKDMVIVQLWRAFLMLFSVCWPVIGHNSLSLHCPSRTMPVVWLHRFVHILYKGAGHRGAYWAGGAPAAQR
jgi:hypothetical protein